MRRGCVLGAWVLVVVVAGCSSTGEGAPTSQTVTTTTAATASAPTTTTPTTTTATTSTSLVVTTSTTAVTTTQPTLRLVPAFFLLDSGGDGVRPGPFLVVVARNCPAIEWAVEGVLNGTTAAEDDGGVTSSIPAFRTRLNSVSVADGVAVVDVSAEFSVGASSATMRSRLAQLVFTVTGYDPEIEGVRVLVEGAPLETLPDGTTLDDPMTRASFYDRLPGILIESPTWEGWTKPPLTVRGIAAVTGGDFDIEVLGSGGDVYATATVVTDNPTGWGAFEVTFAGSEHWSTPQTIWLHVYDTRADGTITSERTQPVSLRLNP